MARSGCREIYEDPTRYRADEWSERVTRSCPVELCNRFIESRLILKADCVNETRRAVRRLEIDSAPKLSFGRIPIEVIHEQGVAQSNVCIG